MLERHHLAILRAIEQQGSLTKAAQSLHLTQSALSHSIKKLELQLGTALWHKRGRQLQLTESGLYLLQTAKRLLPQLEQAEQKLQQIARGSAGQLRIGMECHPCYRWLMGIVEPFLLAWPQVDIDLRSQFQFGGMAALFAHEIDLLVTPDPIQRSGVVFEPVFHYEQVLAVSQSHDLAEQEHVQPAQLNEQVLYTYPVEESRLDIFSLFLAPADCRPRQHRHIEDTEMMLQLVAAKRGVASLPRWLVEEYQNRLAIKALPLGKTGVYKQIYLGRRAESEPPAYLSDFIVQAQG